eukprot:scaffold34929_cov64-Phaeocystis_antarctica.AAC.2
MRARVRGCRGSTCWSVPMSVRLQAALLRNFGGLKSRRISHAPAQGSTVVREYIVARSRRSPRRSIRPADGPAASDAPSSEHPFFTKSHTKSAFPHCKTTSYVKSDMLLPPGSRSAPRVRRQRPRGARAYQSATVPALLRARGYGRALRQSRSIITSAVSPEPSKSVAKVALLVPARRASRAACRASRAACRAGGSGGAAAAVDSCAALSLDSHAGPARAMPTAPSGAVSRMTWLGSGMTSTLSVSTVSAWRRASSPSPLSSTRSSAAPPTAACTVALGSHATQTKSASRAVRPERSSANRVTPMRTTSPPASTNNPRPSSAGARARTSTAAPSNPKRAGCACAHTQLTRACTATTCRWGHLCAAVVPSTTAASAPPPEKSKALPPKTTSSAHSNAPPACAAGPRPCVPGAATRLPSSNPLRMPLHSSAGALSTSHARSAPPPPPSPETNARQTPKPAMASTSSKEAAATTMVGMPLAVPKPRACRSSMPGTTTAGETAAMTKPRVPPGRRDG